MKKILVIIVSVCLLSCITGCHALVTQRTPHNSQKNEQLSPTAIKLILAEKRLSELKMEKRLSDTKVEIKRLESELKANK